jgi:SAM-dependent methyltransferase
VTRGTDTPLSRLKRVLREHPLSRGLYREAAERWAHLRIASVERLHGRYHTAARFDSVFEADEDPWSYLVTPLAHRRRDLLLRTLPRPRYARMLEVGCAEGWMTERLANRADSLVCVDVSRVALGRAQARCAHLPGVTFTKLDILDELPEGPFDGAVCAGVLVFLPRRAQEAVRDRLISRLSPGADLLLENATLGYPGELAGTEIDAIYRKSPQLSLVHYERGEEYEVTLFRKI